MTQKSTHVAIIGSGPVGLEAALACHEHGFPFTLYEASDRPAGHVRSWGHVRLFTPWSMNMSERMASALAELGRELPTADDCPTGHELADRLLEPLARSPAVAPGLRLGCRVLAVGREGLLKHEEIGTSERAGRRFLLLVTEGEEERFETADVVFDCSGSSVPNTLGASGLPAVGERRAEGKILRSVPTADEVSALAGRSVLLVGAGHSAQTALLELVALSSEHPTTHIHWVLRREPPRPDAKDPLPERLSLMTRAAELADGGHVALTVHRGALVESLTDDGERLRVTLRCGGGSPQDVTVDRVIALTGRVGDHELYRQLQVHECYATSGPMKLAAALMGASGGGGDCLAQTSMGPDTLRNPEPGFFILGSKSYGRRNDYLMRVGRQQVDEVFELLD